MHSRQMTFIFIGALLILMSALAGVVWLCQSSAVSRQPPNRGVTP
jgi:hypothetical protein